MKLSYIQANALNENGTYQSFQSQNSSQDPEIIDQFCTWLIKQGIVDEIKYSRNFSLLKETTRALEGKQ